MPHNEALIEQGMEGGHGVAPTQMGIAGKHGNRYAPSRALVVCVAGDRHQNRSLRVAQYRNLENHLELASTY
jgi:hypothetical protein